MFPLWCNDGRPMPSNSRVRKSAKSCTECRRRKTRCVWPSEDGSACQSCMERQLKCETQTHSISAAETVRMASRARIETLENLVAGLRKDMRRLQQRLDIAPSSYGNEFYASSQTNAAQGHDGGEDDDGEAESVGVSPANQPNHIHQLFENPMIGSTTQASPTSGQENFKTERLAALRHLLPTRQVMVTISVDASTWLSLQNELFPMVNLITSGDELLEKYDSLSSPDAQILAVTSVLLSIALTVQLAPRKIKGIDALSFSKTVCEAVEKEVLSDTNLAATLEGIENALLLHRLQIGRATTLRKVWLDLRRTIALGELIGLPKAVSKTSVFGANQPSELRIVQNGTDDSMAARKAEVWEALCAVDRVTCMMWSLPLGMATSTLPKRSKLDTQGAVNPQAYLYELLDISAHVLDLDAVDGTQETPMQLFPKIMVIDQELRNLASFPPPAWWDAHPIQLSSHAMLQYWHQYLIIRTHLRLALAYDEKHGQEYAFSFNTCLNASQQLANRYISLRSNLPVAFFANRVLDLQAFTAATVMLLACHRASTSTSTAITQNMSLNHIFELINKSLDVMERVATAVGGGYARQAAGAIRSLTSLLRQNSTGTNQEVTLRLPLVGQIRVICKSHSSNTEASQTISAKGRNRLSVSHEPNLLPIDANSNSMASQSMESISYSMQPLDVSIDELIGGEEWFSWTGWNGDYS